MVMKLRYPILFAVILLLSGPLSAQEKSGIQEMEGTSVKGKIGLTFSAFGESDVFQSEELVGAPGYDCEHHFAVGIVYLKPLNSWLELETGLEFTRHTISVIPNLPPQNDYSGRQEHLSLLSIPILVRATFLKYLFMNSGLIISSDASASSPIDSQTGFGPLLGAGVKYDFKCGGSLFVNPYIKCHSLVPLVPDDYHQRLMESGVRFGMTWQLPR